MSDSFHSLLVILDRDTPEETVGMLKDAILMLKGVISVDANVADISSAMAEARARREIGAKLWDALYPERSKTVGY